MSGEDKTALQRHIETMKKVLRVILNSKLDLCAISENIQARFSITKGYTRVVNEALQEFVARINNIESGPGDKERDFNLLFLKLLDIRETQKLLMITMDGVREADAIENSAPEREVN